MLYTASYVVKCAVLLFAVDTARAMDIPARRQQQQQQQQQQQHYHIHQQQEQRPLNPHYSNSGHVHTLSESGEHQTLGDALFLHLPNGSSIIGKDFGYRINGEGDSLTYGQIVTLGDFYSNQKHIGHCSPQISDPGLNFSQRTDLFQNIVARLLSPSSKDRSILGCLLNVVKTEIAATGQAQDPAQAYAYGLAGIGGWDFQFFLCTSTYLGIALCNADHFGEDAITAYIAGHAVALQHAKKADSVSGFLDAYFYEAFAQHYLSDLFSAGHLRAPRRILHIDPPGLALDYPADDCNRMMHDEDSANGLWVKNLVGDAWPVFGDKQLGSSKSNRNRQQAVAALQAGADELLKVYSGGEMILPADYAALKLIPRLSAADLHQNYFPLFSFNQTANTLGRRENINSRNDSSILSYNYSTLSTPSSWSPIKGEIAGQGVISNMLPRTIQSFPHNLNSEANVTQVRPVNSTHLVINRYGPTWTVQNAVAQRSWNMFSQDILAHCLNPVDGAVRWAWSETMSGSIPFTVLSGSTQRGSFLQGLQHQVNGSTNILWTVFRDDGTACSRPSRPFHTINSFAPNSGDALIQYCEATAGQGASFFEVWKTSTGLPTSKPTYFSSLKVLPATSRRTYAVFNTTTNSYTLVDIAYEPFKSSNLWTFTRWSAGYASVDTISYWEPATTSSQDATYVLDTTDDNVPRILRTARADAQNYARTFVIYLEFGSINMKVSNFDDTILPSNCDSQSFHFITGVEDAKRLSLINYCRQNTNAIVLSTYAYDPLAEVSLSLISISNVPANYANLFNGVFLKHIVAQPVELWDTTTQLPYQPPQYGLMELFDNYGILGARLMALNTQQTGNIQWIPIGQYPAIAGQISDGLTGVRDGQGFTFN